MSEIRMGATEPIPDAPAFTVSRDSAGILIGVRDNAAPQFAVSRDSAGILIGGWPVAPGGSDTGFIRCVTGNGGVVFGMASVRPVGGQTASVRSMATTQRSSSNPFLATAPNTIVAGDVLVMGLSTWDSTNAVPSGWTLIDELYAASAATTVSLYTRQATEADVGATSYAVANSGAKTKAAHIWAIAGGLEVDFSAFCFEPAGPPPGNFVTEVISADGFGATVDSVFCVFSGGGNVPSYAFPETENSNPVWTLDGTCWYIISYAWHAVWGTP